MIVQRLIEQLERMPQDAEVLVDDTKGYRDPEIALQDAYPDEGLGAIVWV